MVDVSEKNDTIRTAIAKSSIGVNKIIYEEIKEGTNKKGDVFAVAQVAGIMGAKQTSSIIPMCHPLALSAVNITFEWCIDKQQERYEILIEAEVKTKGPTGVEMGEQKSANVGNRSERYLILEDIQDPGNLGTMIRTAEAAGIKAVIMSRNTADIFNPKVTRATMGSCFRVPFIYADNFADAVNSLKTNGIRVYGAYLRGGKNYREAEFGKRCAIMIGNEGNGLTDEAIALADERVFIPMEGKIESLNAAVAAAILMYR